MKSRKDKYNAHKALCKNRVDTNGNPIEFRLTYEEWCKIWDDSGHWHQRGRKVNEYVMSRLNDVGHYEVGNVKIQTQLENMREKNINAKKIAVSTPDGNFKSLTEAAKFYGVDRQTITNWCNKREKYVRELY